MTKLLLVEDDKSLREIYGVRLLAEGYDIVSAGDGEEALAMAIKEKPNLIISDVMMPKISGFDMLDILRSTTETRDIKVIMMTALSSEDQRSRGEQLGADKYLVKSQVGIEDVVRTVHEVLGDSGVAAPAATVESTAPAAPAAAAPVAPTVAPTSLTPQPKLEDDPADNDGPGPLPTQPEELSTQESALPQPTAPFTSPRPDNFGEKAVEEAEESVAPNAESSEPTSSESESLSADIAPLSPEESNQLSQELSASTAPVADGAAPPSDITAPASDPLATPSDGVDATADPLGAADAAAAQTTDDGSDSSQTPPQISGPSAPIS